MGAVVEVVDVVVDVDVVVLEVVVELDVVVLGSPVAATFEAFGAVVLVVVVDDSDFCRSRSVWRDGSSCVSGFVLR
jgi:hypothetical protein